TERRCLYVDASLLDDRGNAVNRERLAFEAFPDIAAGGLPVKAAYIGEDAKRLAASLRLSAEAVAETGADEGADWRGDIPLIVSSGKEFAVRKASLLKRVREGASLLLIRGSGSGGEQDAWEIEGADVEAVRMKTRYTLAIERGTPGLEWMREDDFSYFYDKSCGRIEGIADSQLAGEGLETIVFTYLYRRSAGEKVKLPVVA
ncbi:glycoside hydrolase family 2, partial [Paenibacillus sepulcri]|nr:glycoside hydrolase family 2 [Paenibacillus sepulcri]